jgi:hypothetical protein
MQYRETDSPGEMLWIFDELMNRLPQLTKNTLFLKSTVHFLRYGDYKCFIVEYAANEYPKQPYAFGLIKLYQMPWIEQAAIAVEAAWFAEDNFKNQAPIWAIIASKASRMNLEGVCIAPRSIETPAILDDMLRHGEVGGNPVIKNEFLLQGARSGIYSAFTNEPTEAAFLSSCIMIHTAKVDISGVRL